MFSRFLCSSWQVRIFCEQLNPTEYTWNICKYQIWMSFSSIIHPHEIKNTAREDSVMKCCLLKDIATRKNCTVILFITLCKTWNPVSRNHFFHLLCGLPLPTINNWHALSQSKKKIIVGIILGCKQGIPIDRVPTRVFNKAGRIFWLLLQGLPSDIYFWLIEGFLRRVSMCVSLNSVLCTMLHLLCAVFVPMEQRFTSSKTFCVGCQ